MPRFVLLYHDCPPSYERASHWDFMLESGDVLRTWALERLPCDWITAHELTVATHATCPPLSGDNTVAALKLKDHRRDYLQLEGTLSGDRGIVRRVAAGTYRSEHESPTDWRVLLASAELSAGISLSRAEADEKRWTLSTRYQVPSIQY